MNDVQGRTDDRNIPIKQVGVSGLTYPIMVLDGSGLLIPSVATIAMSVYLPHHFKGTHMSRFVEVLNEHRGEVTMRTLPTILSAIKARLDSSSAKIRVEFPYFVEKRAPVTDSHGMMDYLCVFEAETWGTEDRFLLTVTVPVTSLCPCSKEISDYGAHNQRGYITITVRTNVGSDDLPQFILIEELIEIAEKSASAPVYPLLKRADERHVTMQAYDNPVFVEDMVRNAAVQLDADDRICWYQVRAVNHESIHNHEAFAEVEGLNV